MADDKLNVNPALPQDGDDTVTRKTIKLRPAVMPTAAAPAASPRPVPIANTGDADLADDTQTRRTIKLKPMMATVSAKPAAAAAPAAPAAAPAAPKADGDDTVTRKTIKLRPATPAAAAAPAAAPAKPVAPAAPAEDSGEKTIRIQRPPKPAVTGPAVAPRPVSAAPLAGAPKPAAPMAAAPKPAAPLAGAPKPAVPAQPVKLPTLSKPAEAGAGKSVPELTPLAGGAVGEIYDDAAVAAPSKLYLVMALISLICLIYSTLLITVQFLDLTQGQNTAEKVSFLLPPSSK